MVTSAPKRQAGLVRPSTNITCRSLIIFVPMHWRRDRWEFRSRGRLPPVNPPNDSALHSGLRLNSNLIDGHVLICAGISMPQRECELVCRFVLLLV